MNIVRFLKRCWWLLLLALFSLCVGWKLNGSSIAMWQQMLREPWPPRGMMP